MSRYLIHDPWYSVLSCKNAQNAHLFTDIGGGCKFILEDWIPTNAYQQIPLPLVYGHKYYYKCKTNKTQWRSAAAFIPYADTAGWHDGFDGVKTYTTESPYVILKNETVSPNTSTIFIVCVIDLTETFGSGNEPDLATCRTLFPLPFYAYNVN